MVMARKAHDQPDVSPLPKVSFKRVQEDPREMITGLADKQALHFGFNDGEPFQRPEHYIRYTEPLESELTRQVEYDMDEQDNEWLDMVNKERRANQEIPVSCEAFEILMDRLEKEWYDLTKNIPKPEMAVPSEDSICAICDDAEAENSNAIVFCDGCNLAVHQDCYGVPYIPEGQWLCRKCTVSPESTISCILCPNEGGAFKQTGNGEWAHLLCAIWVPETRVANDVVMEPIVGVEKINKQRWKLKCSICGIRKGACIQCSKSSCFLAFHTTCARREKLLMPMKSAQGAEPATLACYCEKHLPSEQLEIHEAAMAELEESSRTGSHAPSSKKARAYAKSYQLGPPLVPAIIVERILDYTSRIKFTKKDNFVYMLCRYWSLKREARRGAPLLKRLHLEPWSTNTDGEQNVEAIQEKLKYLKLLREDLEHVRMLSEMTRLREMQKHSQSTAIHDVLSLVFFPHVKPMLQVFDKFISSDRSNYFKNPVSKDLVPDYFDIIKNPMCWNIIEAKLEANEYWNMKDFQDDVMLTLDNATTYNKPDTPIYRTATRMKTTAAKMFTELQFLVRSNTSDPSGLRGDLEPPSGLLELLESAEAIDSPDFPYELTTSPLDSLFAYTLGEFKPEPTPPPPTPPPPPKPKRDRKAEKERREQRKLEFATARGGSVPGGPPRTRRERAKADAFEAEAGMSKPPSTAGISGISSVPESAISESSHQTWWRASGFDGVSAGVEGGQALVVQDVDNHNSFSRFNEGWILPSDQRRGGRQPRQDVPPPRKRARTGTSAGTPTNDTAPLPEPASPGVQKSEDGLALQLSQTSISNERPESVADVGGHVISLEGLNRRTRQRAPSSKSQRPPTTIIEKVETPATRRADRQRRVLARKVAEAEAAARGLPPPPPESSGTANTYSTTSTSGILTSPVAGTSADASWEQGSALTSLADDELTDLDAQGETVSGSSLSALEHPDASELEDEEEAEEEDSDVEDPEGRITVTALDALKAARRAGMGPGPCLKLEKKQVLEGGTLVWAKMPSYPWWPSVVFEEDDPEVPLMLQDERVAHSSENIMLLVRFFDVKQSWQWCPTDKVRLLGEDKVWDEKMLSGKEKLQSFRNPKHKVDCRKAYREALDSMENEAGLVPVPVPVEPEPVIPVVLLADADADVAMEIDK